jgi:hypothetical protein
LVKLLFLPHKQKKDEIIFGTRRAGKVWLQPFSDYAELDAARLRRNAE